MSSRDDESGETESNETHEGSEESEFDAWAEFERCTTAEEVRDFTDRLKEHVNALDALSESPEVVEHFLDNEGELAIGEGAAEPSKDEFKQVARDEAEDMRKKLTELLFACMDRLAEMERGEEGETQRKAAIDLEEDDEQLLGPPEEEEKARDQAERELNAREPVCDIRGEYKPVGASGFGTRVFGPDASSWEGLRRYAHYQTDDPVELEERIGEEAAPEEIDEMNGSASVKGEVTQQELIRAISAEESRGVRLRASHKPQDDLAEEVEASRQERERISTSASKKRERSEGGIQDENERANKLSRKESSNSSAVEASISGELDKGGVVEGDFIDLTNEDTGSEPMQIGRSDRVKGRCVPCGRSILPEETNALLGLHVPACNACLKAQMNAKSEADRFNVAYCRCCGDLDGSCMLVKCANKGCGVTFCRRCIETALRSIVKSPWICFFCDWDRLESLREEYQRLIRMAHQTRHSHHAAEEEQEKQGSKGLSSIVRDVVKIDIDESNEEQEIDGNGNESNQGTQRGCIDANHGCVVNEDSSDTEEPRIRMHPHLSELLKPHQLEGVRFMWKNIVGNFRSKGGNDEKGCILAHSMGLGKTVQVIAFLHTVMEYADHFLSKEEGLKFLGGFEKTLILVPVNVIATWKEEFHTFLPSDSSLCERIFQFDERGRKGMNDRISVIEEWSKRVRSDSVSFPLRSVLERRLVAGVRVAGGGVMLIGQEIFKSFVLGNRDRSVCEKISNADIVICDEAHGMKKRKSQFVRAMKALSTPRKIALTGTPLQNQLEEYHTLIETIRPGKLGPWKRFRNAFANPIKKGQAADSTPSQVKKMQKKSFLLHKRLQDMLQRKDVSILRDQLPPKYEYVLSVRLSDVQKQLYNCYIDLINRRGYSRKGLKLIEACSALSKVWNHPSLLERFASKEENHTYQGVASDKETETGFRNQKEDDKGEEESLSRWWDRCPLQGHLKESLRGQEVDVNLSGKFVVLLELIRNCLKRGEKILVFSLSLGVLDMLEEVFASISMQELALRPFRDYFRMDGSTSAEERKRMSAQFNKEESRQRLFLISTKAGGLGINLIGANRVVLFDSSWNPAVDVQAIFRTYRYGQNKSVYVYRLLAAGTMEEKIYLRQVTKEGLSARIVDEQNVSRNFTQQDIDDLFNPVEEEEEEESESEWEKEVEIIDAEKETLQEQSADQQEHRTLPATAVEQANKGKRAQGTRRVALPKGDVPDDQVLARLLVDDTKSEHWIRDYHAHDSLFEDREEERLTEEEREAAWREYMQGEPEQEDEIARLPHASQGGNAGVNARPAVPAPLIPNYHLTESTSRVLPSTLK